MIFAGVDKLKLTTREYSIPDGSRLVGWKEKSGKEVNAAPPEWLRDSQGTTIPVTGLFLDTPEAIIDLNTSGLKIEWNPSKIRHPYHLLTDTAEIGRMADRIQGTLKAHGLLTNVDQMGIARLDLAKNAQLRHHPSAYPPAIAAGCRGGKRMKGREYPDGYSFGNTQRQAVFYNKTRELHECRQLTIPENKLGRMEVRWNKPRPLAKDIPFSAFRDFRKADPEEVTAAYRDAVNNNVFRVDVKAVQLVLIHDTEVGTLAQYIQSGRGGAERYFLDFCTPGTIAGAVGGWDKLTALIHDAHQLAGTTKDPERQARRVLERLREHTNRAAMVNAQRNRAAVNVHTLLDELKQAYAA
jgi:hypothetical protein